MVTRKISYLVVLIGLVFTWDVFAQSKVGTTAAPFLTLGTGSKGTALGHAYTAEARGADAIFWNPAGIAIPVQEKTGSVMFSNYQMFADIQYSALGVTIPLTKNGGVIGIGGGFVDYGDEPVRTETQPEGTGEIYSANDLVIGITYAQPFTDRFYMGGQVKYVSQRIWDMTASTVAVDIGLTLITDYLNGLVLAASIQNFGNKLQLSGINVRDTYDPNPDINSDNDRVFINRELDSWNLPLSFKFGVSVPIIDRQYYQFKVMGESHQTNDQSLNGDFGAEFTFRTNSTNFNLRGGYKDLFLGDNVDSHFTYGAGFDTYAGGVRIGFDFALVDQTYLGQTQMIDLRVYF